MSKLRIDYIATNALIAYPHNARTHSRKQIRQIAKSIGEYGFTNPVLIDSNNMILAGHGRVAAAPLARLTEVPCVRLEEMTPSQKRAYVLANNKLALNAGWDENIFANELQTLLSIDAEFDLDAIAFTIAEADCLMEGLTPEEAGDPADDRMPELAKGKPITVLGDLWQLGDGRLVCGSALEDQPYKLLLAGEKAQMIFADPPYNVPITGHAGNSGKTQHREFAMASGEMSCGTLIRQSSKMAAQANPCGKNCADRGNSVNSSLSGHSPTRSFDWKLKPSSSKAAASCSR